MTTAVLLLASEERRWLNAGLYAEELLRLEGINSVRVLDPARLTEADLASGPRVVLAAEPLRGETAERLRAYVERGGHLTAFLPDPELAALFGFTVTFRSLLGGTLRIRQAGFTDEPLQFHGPLRLLTPPEGAERIAHVVEPEPHPAIVRLRLGAGSATFFLYDLPLSVMLTRQGDPMRAHLHTAGVWHGHRAADLFVGHLDRRRAHLPQADLQCHLLRALLAEGPDAPLPFLWYFPGGVPTVCLLTSDDDWSTREQFEALRDAAREHRARITFYLVPGTPSETTVTPEYKAALEAEGHTVSLHPVHEPPYDLTWAETVDRQRAWYRERFGAPPGPSVRNHCVTWSGYVHGARLMKEAGFRYDANAVSVPPAGEQYQAGAGLPACYVDLDGELLAIYQVPAQFSDETTLGDPGVPFSLNLTEDEGVRMITARLQENVTAHHSMLCINAHPVSFATYSGPMWRRVFSEANRLSVPLLSLDAFMTFWERRAAVTLSAATREPDGWRWTLRVPETAPGMTVMLPWEGDPARVTLDGRGEIPAPCRHLFGRAHLAILLDLSPGEHALVVTGQEGEGASATGGA
jgi:peptidoglycan/xylan/chitin deacetylase (PgdA/CDA1 family)